MMKKSMDPRQQAGHKTRNALSDRAPVDAVKCVLEINGKDSCVGVEKKVGRGQVYEATRLLLGEGLFGLCGEHLVLVA